MKKFKVTGIVQFGFEMEVEAENEDKAQEIAEYQLEEEHEQKRIDGLEPYFWVDYVDEVDNDGL